MARRLNADNCLQATSLPSKIVQGESTVGTVCLDRVPDEPTEVLLLTDNSFAGTVEPTTVVIKPPDQCASLTVITNATGFTREYDLIVSAFANGSSADAVLPIIPFAGYDLVEGDRYVGRFTLDGTPINNVEVQSTLGGCAQRALPFGTSSTHC